MNHAMQTVKAHQQHVTPAIGTMLGAGITAWSMSEFKMDFVGLCISAGGGALGFGLARLLPAAVPVIGLSVATAFAVDRWHHSPIKSFRS